MVVLLNRPTSSTATLRAPLRGADHHWSATKDAGKMDAAAPAVVAPGLGSSIYDVDSVILPFGRVKAGMGPHHCAHRPAGDRRRFPRR